MVVIRTPDQRLRVFVSSTLGELAAERRVVGRAVSALGLVPVLFEAGARPYPPREVYRAYVSQSDVFVGLYWRRYGWVGPGMDVSGLEEEFELSRGLPRLLYVKGPAPGRDPRLAGLIARIEEDGSDCYRVFGTPGELGRLVRGDLAVLLSERFTPGSAVAVAAAGAAGQVAAGGSAAVRFSLPPDTAAFTGRDSELDVITAAVAGAGGSGGVVGIHAIGGMPGVGKTALAVHAAHLLREVFPGRHLFIDLHGHTPGLEPVAPETALAGLLAAVGVDARSLPGDLAGRAGLWRDKLAGQRVLLVLDNAAHSAQVTPLLPGGGGCLVLVTSRRHLGDLPGPVVPVLVDTLTPGQAREMFLRLAPRAATGPDALAAVLPPPGPASGHHDRPVRRGRPGRHPAGGCSRAARRPARRGTAHRGELPPVRDARPDPSLCP